VPKPGGQDCLMWLLRSHANHTITTTDCCLANNNIYTTGPQAQLGPVESCSRVSRRRFLSPSAVHDIPHVSPARDRRTIPFQIQFRDEVAAISLMDAQTETNGDAVDGRRVGLVGCPQLSTSLMLHSSQSIARHWTSSTDSEFICMRPT